MSLFLLPISIIAIFADSSCSSMIYWKHPTNLALSRSTTTVDLHRIPSVQSSVPLHLRTVLIASSSILSLPSSMPIPLMTVVMNWMISLGTTSMPQQWCWTQGLLLSEAQSPRTSPLQADIIIPWFCVEWWKWKKLLSEFQCLMFFRVPCTRCAQGETQERGRHKNGLYSRVDDDGISMLPMNLAGMKSQWISCIRNSSTRTGTHHNLEAYGSWTDSVHLSV